MTSTATARGERGLEQRTSGLGAGEGGERRPRPEQADGDGQRRCRQVHRGLHTTTASRPGAAGAT